MRMVEVAASYSVQLDFVACVYVARSDVFRRIKTADGVPARPFGWHGGGETYGTDLHAASATQAHHHPPPAWPVSGPLRRTGGHAHP